MTDNNSKLEFVTIGDKEYSRMSYKCGLTIYAVKTSQINRYGRYIWRNVNSPITQARIDAAIEVKQ